MTNTLGLHPFFHIVHSYQLLSYGFVHAGFLHFGFNMIVLLFIGATIEGVIGTKSFIFVFLFSIVGSGLVSQVYFYISPWPPPSIIVGCSGALCALLIVYWNLYPTATVLLFFILPLPIQYFMYGIIAFDCIGTLFPIKTGLAHITHCAGYACGLIFVKRQSWFKKISGVFSCNRTTGQVIPGRFDKERYYSDNIDPILKKISQTGIESLSRKEKEILEKAGKNKG